jgi:hypothetical protein
MRRALFALMTAGCVIPPAPTTPTSTPADLGPPAGDAAGRWVSEEWASYTNPAMVSADFYLDVTIAEDGTFHGSWARYLCLTEAYGIWSCGKGQLEGAASGRLDPDGTGVIELERAGRSTLGWSGGASSIAIELPSDWIEEGVLFRSTVHR